MSRAKLAVQLSSCAVGVLLGALATSACSDEPECGGSVGEVLEGSYTITTVQSDQPELNAALSDAAPAMISVGPDQVRIVYARGGEPASALYDVVRRYPVTTLTEYRP